VSSSPVVAVVGIGRVGLPLALFLAERGCTVYGIDANAAHLAAIRTGTMPFREEGAQPLLSAHLGTRFLPTDDLSVVRGAHTIVVTLGTPVDEHNNPIYLPIEQLVRALLPHLQPKQLLVLRSTLSPGTTEHLARFIERTTSYVVGRDLFLAFCPERIAEGRSIEELPTVPQIVGGVDAPSTRAAVEFFHLVTPVVHEVDSRSAELSKLFCNMYRFIDFAIANEFMMIAEQHGRDIYPIVHAINSGYTRGGLKSPGLASGPCLYKDGFFLTGRIPYNELISGAWKINETMPAYLMERVRAVKPLEGSKAAVLGLAFKKNIDDARNSLSFKLRKLLLAEGAEVRVHDPMVPSEPFDDAVRDADIVFYAMNHDAFRDAGLAPVRRRARPDAVVCDVWNMFGTGKTLFRLSES
jgi:UDP-N-acetyl-D-mannosaminuronic acid dehydrogenase